MPRYRLTITHTCVEFQYVTVTADSPDEAEEIALGDDMDPHIDEANRGWRVDEADYIKDYSDFEVIECKEIEE